MSIANDSLFHKFRYDNPCRLINIAGNIFTSFRVFRPVVIHNRLRFGFDTFSIIKNNNYNNEEIIHIL